MTPSHHAPGRDGSDPFVAVVIVAFNDWSVLKRCIASLEAGTYRRFCIVVADNSLSDAIEKELRGKSRLEYLKTGRNIGYSRACNLGLSRSLEMGADYSLVLNPDTELDTRCLEELLHAAKSHELVGIVGGRIYYAATPERIWYAGGRLSYWQGVGKHLGFGTADDGAADATQAVSYATGCCMLIPNPVLKRVGLLKESIFMYLDDAEFCMRVLKAGYRIWYQPSAKLWHVVGPGTDRYGYPDYYLYFSIRNKPLVASGGIYALYLHGYALFLAACKAVVYGMSPGVQSRREKLKAIVWGAWDSLFSEAREEKRFPRLFGEPGKSRTHSRA